jgi:cation transporter-like permease
MVAFAVGFLILLWAHRVHLFPDALFVPLVGGMGGLGFALTFGVAIKGFQFQSLNGNV